MLSTCAVTLRVLLPGRLVPLMMTIMADTLFSPAGPVERVLYSQSNPTCCHRGPRTRPPCRNPLPAALPENAHRARASPDGRLRNYLCGETEKRVPPPGSRCGF